MEASKGTNSQASEGGDFSEDDIEASGLSAADLEKVLNYEREKAEQAQGLADWEAWLAKHSSGVPGDTIEMRAVMDHLWHGTKDTISCDAANEFAPVLVNVSLVASSASRDERSDEPTSSAIAPTAVLATIQCRRKVGTGRPLDAAFWDDSERSDGITPTMYRQLNKMVMDAHRNITGRAHGTHNVLETPERGAKSSVSQEKIGIDLGLLLAHARAKAAWNESWAASISGAEEDQAAHAKTTLTMRLLEHPFRAHGVTEAEFMALDIERRAGKYATTMGTSEYYSWLVRSQAMFEPPAGPPRPMRFGDPEARTIAGLVDTIKVWLDSGMECDEIMRWAKRNFQIHPRFVGRAEALLDQVLATRATSGHHATSDWSDSNESTSGHRDTPAGG